ncbi:MexE family multidrug efflux RND transporter periplasmic adaptor subunit [Marinobacterium zhoushanense]|uniref:MexE family multidrug efflux RND transporter periplasmic adaptor subunit n=1 Tax=Marinobacterium zhoushanense TaxID=1679163 RepID=A0ABQ1KVK3_9GAMM|nr:efflux RND transporter periplasmic adaptor subunit [Marinobacterium zhoushanense]GGC11893.1 MexE family multidrug efflux RND transporter periplasmic adaptor subunit [Marinobacterium zhoushanense]
MGTTITSLRRWPAGLMAAALLLGLAGCQDSSDQGATTNRPPTAVDVVTLESVSVDITESYPGRVAAYRSAEIRPQVGGIILARKFEEGSHVDAGDLLYQIDPALYKAELASAESELALADANAQSARLLAERYRELVKSSAVSRQDADNAEAAWKQAQAQIQAAKASVQSAKINLDYTRITAPISGIISRSSVTEGALVSAAQSGALATIRQLSPVYVDIRQPASSVMKMKRSGDDLTADVQLQLEDGSQLDETGTLKFSESSVDEGTGTVNVRAQFQNDKELLLPGMFVRASVVVEHQDAAILAPQQGITRLPNGAAQALVVNADNQVESRPVEVGRAIADKWLVLSGLAAGDKLIIGGLQKIKAGATVTPREQAAVTAGMQ